MDFNYYFSFTISNPLYDRWKFSRAECNSSARSDEQRTQSPPSMTYAWNVVVWLPDSPRRPIKILCLRNWASAHHHQLKQKCLVSQLRGNDFNDPNSINIVAFILWLTKTIRLIQLTDVFLDSCSYFMSPSGTDHPCIGSYLCEAVLRKSLMLANVEFWILPGDNRMRIPSWIQGILRVWPETAADTMTTPEVQVSGTG